MLKWIAVVLLCGTLSVHAQTPPRLLHDIATSGAASSDPDGFVSNGELVFFFADDSAGRSLWRTDGTPFGTRKVKELDIYWLWQPPLVASGNLVYFDMPGGFDAELWRSDGTASGTFALAPMSADQLPVPFGARGAMFVGQDGALFVTDGTKSGTRLVRGDLGAHRLMRAGDQMFFRSANQLWRTDGTFAGTEQVVRLSDDEEPGPTIGQIAIGDTLYFLIDKTFHAELWRADGTEASIIATFEYYPEIRMQVLGGALYVFVEQSRTRLEIWRVEDTTPSLMMVLEDEFLPYHFVEATSSFIFFAMRHVVGEATVWRTDGTPGGTQPVGTFSDYSVITFGLATPTRFYVQIRDDDAPGLYVTDGHDELQRLSSSVHHGIIDLGSAALGERLFTVSHDPLHGNELWTSDGTPSGTRMLKNIHPDGNSGGWRAQPFAGSVLFNAAGVDGAEPWISDGTAAATFQLADIHAGEQSSDPRRFADLGNGRSVFWAYDPAHGNELWSTDGTRAGTNLVLDLAPGSAGSSTEWFQRAPLVVAHGRAFLFTNLGAKGQIWTTNGTAAGTKKVADIDYNEDVTPVLAGPFVYYADGDRLARTDGTAAGTFVIGPLPFEIVAAEDRLFFITRETELWVTDGSIGGTRRLATTGRRWLETIGRDVLFAAQDSHGPVLWYSDGTEAGTERLHDVAPNTDVLPVSTGSEVFFAGDDGVHGVELWRSDGTRQGTELVHDIAPGAESATPLHLGAIGQHVYFSADDGVHGREVWRTAGGAAELVADVEPGPDASAPRDFLRTRNGVFFFASTEATGDEPWVVDAPPSKTRSVR